MVCDPINRHLHKHLQRNELNCRARSRQIEDVLACLRAQLCCDGAHVEQAPLGAQHDR